MPAATSLQSGPKSPNVRAKSLSGDRECFVVLYLETGRNSPLRITYCIKLVPSKSGVFPGVPGPQFKLVVVSTLHLTTIIMAASTNANETKRFLLTGVANVAQTTSLAPIYVTAKSRFPILLNFPTGRCQVLSLRFGPNSANVR